MKQTVSKKPETTICKPTDHSFVALDTTPHVYPGSAGIGQLGYNGSQRQYIAFCTKCGASKRIV